LSGIGDSKAVCGWRKAKANIHGSSMIQMKRRVNHQDLNQMDLAFGAREMVRRRFNASKAKTGCHTSILN